MPTYQLPQAVSQGFASPFGPFNVVDIPFTDLGGQPLVFDRSTGRIRQKFGGNVYGPGDVFLGQDGQTYSFDGRQLATPDEPAAARPDTFPVDARRPRQGGMPSVTLPDGQTVTAATAESTPPPWSPESNTLPYGQLTEAQKDALNAFVREKDPAAALPRERPAGVLPTQEALEPLLRGFGASVNPRAMALLRGPIAGFDPRSGKSTLLDLDPTHRLPLLRENAAPGHPAAEHFRQVMRAQYGAAFDEAAYDAALSGGDTLIGAGRKAIVADRVPGGPVAPGAAPAGQGVAAGIQSAAGAGQPNILQQLILSLIGRQFGLPAAQQFAAGLPQQSSQEAAPPAAQQAGQATLGYQTAGQLAKADFDRAFGKARGQEGYSDTYDVNKDGLVNILDFSRIRAENPSLLDPARANRPAPRQLPSGIFPTPSTQLFGAFSPSERTGLSLLFEGVTGLPAAELSSQILQGAPPAGGSVQSFLSPFRPRF